MDAADYSFTSIGWIKIHPAYLFAPRHNPPPPNGTGWADRSPHPHLRPVRPVPIFCGLT
jgi:hypothetical protein